MRWTIRSGGSPGVALRARQAAAVLLASALTAATTACGDDADEEARTPQAVVVGVLLDGEEPAADVELELLVWPSPQSGSTAAPGEAPELVQLDTDTTDDDGTFTLEALGEELSPHATHDGRVGIEVRQVGVEGRGQGMSVRLSKARDTGVIEVEAVEEVELALGAVGAAEG